MKDIVNKCQGVVYTQSFLILQALLPSLAFVSPLFPSLARFSIRPQLSESLEQAMSRLESDQRQYQNLRSPDFHSCAQSSRSTEGDPICSFCNRMGHTWRACRQCNRDPRVPPQNTQLGYTRLPTTRPPSFQ